MKRKKLVTAILVGVAVTGIAVYLISTRSGQKEWQRLKKTGKAAAKTFKTFGQEVNANIRTAQREQANLSGQQGPQAALVG